MKFEPHCAACPRLAAFLSQVRADNPGYHAAPVAPFGAPDPRLLIVGLAPGMHGANRTGRPFTGDHAGILLYQTLFDFGFASGPESVARDDGLRLIDCRITNAVKCLPPQNKPNGDEIRCCNGFLAAEIKALPPDALILALGAIAHNAVLRAMGEPASRYPFGHANEHSVAGKLLLDSYHCSRYNTQTRRLTPEMFRAVFARARSIIGS
ncbi:MAG: uracil-DNA glycosylase [Gammaproteobacteria bacterium]|nr:uracil-DNA glycosylase [Gammaproteobacteria bacterium]MBU1654667.1 uracil-DNA glycosylase [Gammaproteobacteria bacterium]MBU1961390.1 uracil-DNA glycosylase [Gammaproteobacteria bacterium]